MTLEKRWRNNKEKKNYKRRGMMMSTMAISQEIIDREEIEEIGGIKRKCMLRNNKVTMRSQKWTNMRKNIIKCKIMKKKHNFILRKHNLR